VLLDRTIEAAAARGAAGMWLGTNAANRRAQRFYEKAGFERVGTRRFQVGGRLEDDVVMERGLA
jgi:ribosomal protein S18 acetylase RimI-like enzyme